MQITSNQYKNQHTTKYQQINNDLINIIKEYSLTCYGCKGTAE